MTRPTPFTIIIDTAEQLPFAFDELRTDADGDNELWEVKTVRGCLGRHPNSFGDYSIIGFEQRIAVERKSMYDLQSTVLGWDGHRDRFEKELANLSQLESAAIVVECSFLDVICHAPEYGKKSKAQNSKILARSILAYQNDYKVQWIFAGDRKVAQYATFHWFNRFWQHDYETTKKATREKEREQRRLANVQKALQARLFRTEPSQPGVKA
jgi:DNA excision repair protein ERCC-4